MLKKCSNCNDFLLLNKFSRAKKGTFGRQGYCKICATLKQKKYFADNKEVLIQKRIAWRKADDIGSILSGKRSIDDLELLCKPCNNIHYLEFKFGPLPYKIIWGINE